jgi:DNA polymerase/3'-5' exonuclease PolX
LRIEIAGSIRRQRPHVKDVEICAIPLQEPSDLFGAELVTCEGFCAVVNQWRKDIGEPTGKYTRRFLPGGIKLDLFIVDPESWGLQLVYRTGSTDFNRCTLLPALKRHGYASLNGSLFHHGVLVPVHEESDLFALAGLPWVEPMAREVH